MVSLNPLMASWRQVAESHAYIGGLSRDKAKRQTADDLTALGLAGDEARLPGQLSGGMAQRVAFAAATAGRAPILLADEPTKGLDKARRDKVVALLAEGKKASGALLVITHEAFVAKALQGRIMVLREGDLVEEGVTRQVLEAPQAEYTKALLAADPAKWPKAQPQPVGRPVLTAANLSIGRGDKTLLAGFSLTLREGEKVAITGPSGVGKSTLLDTLAGLTRPFGGAVERADGLGRHAIQKLYQDPPAAFAPRISLETSLRDAARLHRTPWIDVLAKLDDLHLGHDLLARRPSAVSGGELQRLSLVRALIARPKILLADEPASRLDPITQFDVMAKLATISAQQRIAVVLVTHDHDIAARWADRVVDLPSDRKRAIA